MMKSFHCAGVVKVALIAGATMLLVGCASHEHSRDRYDDREVVVVHDHRYDRPYDHEHEHYDHDRRGGYYAERDAYHGDHRGWDHDQR